MRMVLSADADSRRSPDTSTAHTISSCPCTVRSNKLQTQAASSLGEGPLVP